MKATSAWCGLIGGMLTFAICSSFANAQVAPDGTLNTTVSQSGNDFTITNGNRVGNNLFHSFSQFSVPSNGSAFFNNASDIQNIFSRVTGGSVSNIDGLIKANGSANLFLLNPSGIIFGQNASLNIGGSFVGTTANSIKFADGVEFSATNLSATPLLTMSVPSGLQLGANAGSIQVQGAQLPNSASGLQVKTGQTLALVGGQIDMFGANLSAADGRIELWALQNGEIAINNQAGWQLTSDPNTANWGNILLRQSSSIDAGGIDGGAINIRGRGLTVQDGSNISSTTSAGQGKGITIQTTEFVDLLGDSAPGQLFLSGVNTSVGKQSSFFAPPGPPGPPTTGRAGDITIETPRLQLANGAWLQSTTSGNNSIAGDITIRAIDVDMVGYTTSLAPAFNVSTIASLITAGSNNVSGKVILDAQRVRLLDGSRISSSLLGGNGVGGEVSIQAQESLEIRGINPYGITSAVLASIEAGATGQGGRISIESGSLVLANGGTVSSELAGAKTFFFFRIPGAQGTAGDITIRARDIQVSDPLIDGFSGGIAGITAALDNGAVGVGGNINLTADNLRVFNGGQIISSSQGQGNAGNINLQVKNIDVQGMSQPLRNGQILPSAIAASSTTNFDAGTVNITSDTVRVRDGAEITVSNTGTGNAGNPLVTS